jgi:ribonuclease E
MTEEAVDPAVSAGEGSSAEARPRPRRRRRGGRGRGRGGARAQAGSSGTAEKTEQEAQGPSTEAEGTPARPARRAPARQRGTPKGPDEGRPPESPAAEKDGSGEAAPTTTQRSRTRRGSRGRGRPRRPAQGGDGQKQAAVEAPEAAAAPDPPDQEAPGDGAAEKESATAPARRRRRRRKPAAQPQAAAEKAEAKPERDGAPTRRRGGAQAARPTAAPTRTSRTGRRGATERRRRQPVVQVERRTEKTMLMTEDHGRLQIVVLEERQLVEHYVTRSGAQSMVGNIYVGRVQNVLPGMEAAFVDVGRGRNAVLYAGEVSYDEDVEAGERRIESVLKSGQSVLVQVTKDPLKGKGARLTAQVSLPGRYLVYVPDGGASGISRRLPDPERERLRKVIKRIRPSEAGVIVRTAAEGASEQELEADLDRLKKTWDSIKRRSRRARPPKALYEEPELVERVVRDVFSPTEFQHIVTDSREIHDRVAAYLNDVAPDLLGRLQLHEGKLPLFESWHVSEQIHKALERKVWLPSGGYLVIDRSEAMTVIDVNTGKAVGRRNLEETVTATNLEAAREIPRQLRLRDIGGIIVIDFIDMMLAANRDQVVQTLREELVHDKTRSRVFDITALGLLEMTRKKVSAGLLEAFSEPCPTCEGRGILLTHES